MLLNSILHQCHMLQNLTHQLYYHDLRMNPHKMSTLFSLKPDIMMLIFKFFGYHVCLLWDKYRAEVSYCMPHHLQYPQKLSPTAPKVCKLVQRGHQ